jgi:hypothetical protein
MDMDMPGMEYGYSSGSHPSQSSGALSAENPRASGAMQTGLSLSRVNEDSARLSETKWSSPYSVEHPNFLSALSLYAFWRDLEIGFEARVYDMTGLDAHEYSRRSRAIKRLRSRTVLKTKWEHLQVVIYRTDTPKTAGSGKQNLEAISKEQAQQIEKAKSARQRESQKLRQYDRRWAKASRKAQQDATEDQDDVVKTERIETPRKGDLASILDKKSLALLLLLYYAFELTEKRRKQLPMDIRQITVKFLESLRFEPMRMRSARNKQSILDRKDCDLVVLKRLIAKLPSAESLSDEQLHDYYWQYAKFERGPEGSRTIQDNLIKLALAQHRIIQSGHRTVSLAIQSVVDAKAAIRKWFSTGPALAKDKIGQIGIGSLYGPHGTLRREDKWRVHSFTDSPEDSGGSQRISRRKRWLLFKEAMEEIQGKELGDMLSFQSSQMQESVRS